MVSSYARFVLFSYACMCFHLHDHVLAYAWTFFVPHAGSRFFRIHDRMLSDHITYTVITYNIIIVFSAAVLFLLFFTQHYIYECAFDIATHTWQCPTSFTTSYTHSYCLVLLVLSKQRVKRKIARYHVYQCLNVFFRSTWSLFSFHLHVVVFFWYACARFFYCARAFSFHMNDRFFFVCMISFLSCATWLCFVCSYIFSRVHNSFVRMHDHCSFIYMIVFSVVCMNGCVRMHVIRMNVFISSACLLFVRM